MFQLSKRNRLTHHFQLEDVGLRIAFDVGRNAGVISGLLSRHALQDEARAADDDAGMLFLLNHHILKSKKLNLNNKKQISNFYLKVCSMLSC